MPAGLDTFLGNLRKMPAGRDTFHGTCGTWVKLGRADGSQKLSLTTTLGKVWQPFGEGLKNERAPSP